MAWPSSNITAACSAWMAACSVSHCNADPSICTYWLFVFELGALFLMVPLPDKALLINSDPFLLYKSTIYGVVLGSFFKSLAFAF